MTAASNPGNATVKYEYKKKGAGNKTYTETVPTDADTYTVRATIPATQNYNGATGTAEFTIEKLEVTLNWINTEFTYDGNPHEPTAIVTNLVNSDVCMVTVDGTQTNAGTYTATATGLSNNNYKLPTPAPSTTFTIWDRKATIDFGERKYKTFYSASETFLVPDDVQAYIVTGVNGNEVTTQEVSYIPKQTPVLLEAKAGAKSVKNTADDFKTNKLVYASNDVIADGKQYILYKDEFVRASGTINGKVYLDLSGSNSPARTYVISTNNTTAIEAVFDEEAYGEEKWYDMQGRRINKPTKAGLYIKNGQKLVIKNK